MAGQLLNATLVIALVGALVYATRRFFAPADALGISFFRPWRGDPWPIGVQEDDDVKFNWAVPEADAVLPMIEPPSRPSSRPRREERARVGEAAVIEDITRTSVETVPLDHVEIRRLGR